MRILVSGWRFLPHSYAMVNQFQLLEMLERPGLTLYHRDVPRYADYWTPSPGLFPADAEERLRSIPPLPDRTRPDVELRISYPYDILGTVSAARTCVFGTAELGAVPAAAIGHGVPLADAHRRAADVVIITPSRWSREGFLRSGAVASRLEIVPHGVDPAIFAPPDAEERRAARTKFGIDPEGGEPVFLHVGACTGNKGIGLLLRAFAAVVAQHPHARLLVKGLDAFYASRDLLIASAGELSLPEMQRVLARMSYIGGALPLSSMRQIYHAADCYVAPYTGEGFNLPVLEAAACGLPVVCTAGGPTDDFTTDEFALRIDSACESFALSEDVVGLMLKPSYEHLVEHMLHVCESADLREQARSAGPAHVRRNHTWKHAVDRLLEVFRTP